MITGIIVAAVVVGCVGIILGFFLGIAGEKFKVETDPREDAILEVLPGNNCGGCGYAGCSGLAAAIAKGEAPVNQCPVGGEPVAAKVGEIMGVSAGASVHEVAFVKCGGDCEKAKQDYEYTGVEDCAAMAFVPNGGPKSCNYGCLGFGNCVKACPFDAIHVVDGIAKVDPKVCKACGKCVAACPKHFAVNSQELRRMAMDAVIDERTLREIYLTGFEIAVKEGKSKAIMSSYNQINGTYANENEHLLTDILRDEWGFDGIVVSDWGGNNDPVKAVDAGANLEMPNCGYGSAREIVKAVKDGRLSAGHARALLPLPAARQREAAETIAAQGLSVRQTEALVKRLTAEKKEREPSIEEITHKLHAHIAEEELAQSLGRGVKIVAGRKKGRIELDYYDMDDLNDLLDALGTLQQRKNGGTKK
mgnify:CR=1 FL=1